MADPAEKQVGQRYETDEFYLVLKSEKYPSIGGRREYYNLPSLGLNNNAGDITCTVIFEPDTKPNEHECVLEAHVWRRVTEDDEERPIDNELNQPAARHKDGTVEYVSNGWLHRTDGPAYVHADGCQEWREQGRLHRVDGPAIVYPSGNSTYYWRGVEVPGHILEHPEQLTIDQVLNESNQELRAIMIDRIGMGNFLIKANAKQEQEDKYGILYSLTLGDGQVLKMVHVIDASPDLDGSFKKHFIGVPTDIKTAHEGIAWSFYKTPETWNPDIQT